MWGQPPAAVRRAKLDHFPSIDNPQSAAYNLPMGSLDQPTPVTSPDNQERDSSRIIIFVAVAGVIAVMLGLAFFLREAPKAAKTVPAYAANLKFSDFKMSAAENFIGHTVSYVDGSVTNSGGQTVTRIVVEVTFKDELGQLAQRDELALQLLKTSGAYDQAVDVSVSPLAPGQTQPFRLTFDSISQQWNHQYPELRVTDLTAK